TVDLPNLIELKYTCKYRLILDEGISLAQRDEPDAGLTELYNVSVCVSFVSLCRLLAQLNRKGHANRHDRRISCQWAQLIGRFLRGFAYRRGSPAHQRHILRPLRRGPGPPCSLRL
ncbi:hypothetical protein EDB89DRAFT_2034469, partial [Lactarius sanguifluus]